MADESDEALTALADAPARRKEQPMEHSLPSVSRLDPGWPPHEAPPVPQDAPEDAPRDRR